MLQTTKNITITGVSLIDNKEAERYQATIEEANPQDMQLSSWQVDKALYKGNRVQCRLDAAEFEELAYALQDKLISELKINKGGGAE